jgi:hypothetical protein
LSTRIAGGCRRAAGAGGGDSSQSFCPPARALLVVALKSPIMSTTHTHPTFMFVFRSPVDQPDGSPQEMQQSFEKWMIWIRSMKAKGQYLAGEPLEETPAKVLRGPRGGKATDGPFAEAKEVVAGYMLIAAKDFAEAVEIARDCPGYARNGSVEIRPIMPIPM